MKYRISLVQSGERGESHDKERIIEAEDDQDAIEQFKALKASHDEWLGRAYYVELPVSLVRIDQEERITPISV